MKKTIFSLFITLIFFTGCQRNEIIETHGISYLEKREALLTVNKSNKNDTIQIMGQPATKGLNDENLWIYIERTKSRGKLLKIGKSYLKKNNVLVLEFSKYGVLVKKDLFNKDDMNKLTFAKTVTENEVKKENFIVGFLSSIRQKMEAKKK